MTFDDLPNKLVCFHYVCDENYQIRDFPSGLVIKTWPSNAGGAGSIPGQGKQKNEEQGLHCEYIQASALC